MTRFILVAALLAAGPAWAKSKKAPEPVAAAVPPPPDPLGTQPEVPLPAAFTPATATASKLSNGASLWVIPNPTLPIFSLVVTVPGGSTLDPAGKEGTASLAMEMLRRGAGSRDAEAFAAETGRRGLSIETGTGPDGSSIVLSGTTEQLEVGLDLVADMILRPKLPAPELKKARELFVTSLQQNLSEPGWVAARTATSLWWGPSHPYGRPADGTQAGLKKVGMGDIKKWHKAAWVSGGSKITVSGAVDAAGIQAQVEQRLGAPWKVKAPVATSVPAPAMHRAEPIYLVDSPGSAQTGFYLVFPGLKAGHPQAPPARMGTIALGGTFTSRLNALLREKKGYTYGVRAALDEMHWGGTFVVRSRIRTDVTAPALVDLMVELEGIRQGITYEELVKAQGAFRQDVVSSLESVAGAAGAFSDAHEAGLAPDFLRTDLETASRVGVAGVKAAMGAYDISTGLVVLVGDKAIIEPELKKSGFTLITTVTPP